MGILHSNINQSPGMNRKEFLGLGTSALVGASLPGMKSNRGKEESEFPPFKRYSYKQKVRDAVKYRKIDLHNHLRPTPGYAARIDESCRRVGITRTAVSLIRARTPEEMRKNNDLVLKAMREFPDRILGSCYINPGYQKEAIAEIDRCVSEGMVMVGELYDDYKINDPIYFPIIERCIYHNIPIMMHAAATLPVWRPEYWKPTDNKLSTSTAEDFIEVGQRYPEAMIICGHVGGGGDWEFACQMLKETNSIYTETSGSVTDSRMINLTVQSVGVERVLFATDVNYETSIGKIMDANLTEEERKKIFFDNFNNLLRRAGNHVD